MAGEKWGNGAPFNKGSPALFFNKRGLFKNKAAAYFSVRGVWGALVDLQYSALLSIKK
jgi:hypothetical protein